MVDTNDVLPTDEREARIVWSLLAEPGDVTAFRYRNEFDTVLESVLSVIQPDSQARPTDLDYQAGLERWLPRTTRISAIFVAALAQLTLHGIQTVIPGDDNWPGERFEARLGATTPVILYVLGDVELLHHHHRTVVVSGARAASNYGEHAAMEFAAGMSDRGYVLVASASYGIDGTVARATLASRGKTIAVLAGGVDRFYPAGHEALLERIAEAGTVVSELPPGALPSRDRFKQRGRIVAALADGVVIVEAGFRSGSMATAGYAAAMGIPLGAVPGPITSPTSAGCHRLIRECGATCITSVDEIVELIS